MVDLQDGTGEIESDTLSLHGIIPSTSMSANFIQGWKILQIHNIEYKFVSLYFFPWGKGVFFPPSDLPDEAFRSVVIQIVKKNAENANAKLYRSDFFIEFSFPSDDLVRNRLLPYVINRRTEV